MHALVGVDAHVLPLVAVALLLLAGGLLLERRRRRVESRALGEAAAALAARHEGRSLHGEHEGTPYHCWYTPAARHATPSVTVAIAAPTRGDFCVARERAAHRLWKRIRLSREIATGDPEFDHDFYVATEVPAFTAAVLAAPAARTAVTALFQLRCSDVRHAGDVLEAHWRHVGATAVDPPLLRIAVSHLASLARVIARLPEQPTVPVAPHRGPGALVTVPLVLAVVAVIALLSGPGLALLDPGALFLASLRWSLPACAFHLVVAASRVAGRSTSHRELAAIALLALVGFPLAGFAALRWGNVGLDDSPPRAHAVRVLQKYRASTRGVARGGWVEVESWRGGGRERIPVARADWDRLSRTGPGLTVVTRAGRLGFEWVESYRLEAAAR